MAIDPALIRKGTKVHAVFTDTTINPEYPLTVVAGELLLLVHSKGVVATSLTGWVPVDNALDGDAAVMQVFSRVANGTETGTVAVPNTTRSTAQILAVPGGGTITTSKNATTGTGAASLTLPAVAGVAGSVLIYAVAGTTGLRAYNGDTVDNIEIEDFGGNVGRSGAIYRDTLVGGTGDRTVAPTSGLVRMAGLMLRIAPVLSGESGSAYFYGSATLSTEGTSRPGSSVALSGSGTLSAGGAPGPRGSVAFSGSGTLSAGGKIIVNLFDLTAMTTSFEDGTTTGWAGRTNVASLASVAGSASHGIRSMKVTATAAGGTVGVTTAGFHPCTPGGVYSFSFHMTSPLVAQCFVDWYNDSGAFLASSGVYLGAPAGGAARFNFNGLTAPAGATQFKMYAEGLSVPAGGSFNVDAFQYQQASAGTPYAGTAIFSTSASFTGSGTLAATGRPVTLGLALRVGSGQQVIRIGSQPGLVRVGG